jgi:hypothetical protein
MCTVECGANPAMCDAIAQGSICVSAQPDIPGGKSFCMRPCFYGAPDTPEFTRCRGRDDMVCFPFDQNDPLQGAYCAPQCRSDADCGTRHCDLRTGGCADVTSGSLPIGAACDTGAVPDPCNGYCVRLDNAATPGPGVPGVCAAWCTLGQIGCGVSGKAPMPAACFFSAADAAPGDVASCAALCDCNDDCVEGFVCQPIQYAYYRTTYGHRGYCAPPVDPSTGAPANGVACAGSSNDAGTVTLPDAAAPFDARATD